MSNYVNPLSTLAATPLSQTRETKPGTWFEAMARAWGDALDNQANTIQQQSEAINNGGDNTPSAITELTAQSMIMGFMSTSSHTSLSTVGEALKTMAQKQ
jgi:hypothetical protein